MQFIGGDYAALGYVIAACDVLEARIREIRSQFEARFLPRFGDDAARNRAIIKLLAEDLDVKRFFASVELEGVLKERLGLREPVQTGPIVTHYTAANATGNNYGLPYHQDWPSMGTSSRALIAWTSITDVGKVGPGLRIVPGSHAAGLWPGRQMDHGYVLEQQDIDGYMDVEIKAGQVLFMSPYLVHKTRVVDQPVDQPLDQPDAQAWKLSLSCRFDDMGCEQWSRRNFVSAYRTAVDREAYLK